MKKKKLQAKLDKTKKKLSAARTELDAMLSIMAASGMPKSLMSSSRSKSALAHRGSCRAIYSTPGWSHRREPTKSSNSLSAHPACTASPPSDIAQPPRSAGKRACRSW